MNELPFPFRSKVDSTVEKCTGIKSIDLRFVCSQVGVQELVGFDSAVLQGYEGGSFCPEKGHRS